MTDSASVAPKAPAASRRWLPPPGCLLLFTTIGCLALVGGGVARRIHRQRTWVESLTQLGGQVHTEPLKPEWLQRVVEQTFGADAAEGLAEITMIHAGGTPLNDDMLRELRGNTRLTWLSLANTRITDGGLQSLETLTGLRELSLRGTQLTDVGLRHVAGLSELQSLDLSNTQITNAGLESLRGLRNLRRLALDGVPVSGAGLQHLSGLVRLEALWLGDAQVTDADLLHLMSLGGLQFLSLTSRNITDSGLMELSSLRKLEGLTLWNTRITPDGAKSFRERLPACRAAVFPASGEMDLESLASAAELIRNEPEVFLTPWPTTYLWDAASF